MVQTTPANSLLSGSENQNEGNGSNVVEFKQFYKGHWVKIHLQRCKRLYYLSLKLMQARMAQPVYRFRGKLLFNTDITFLLINKIFIWKLLFTVLPEIKTFSQGFQYSSYKATFTPKTTQTYIQIKFLLGWQLNTEILGYTSAFWGSYPS